MSQKLADNLVPVAKYLYQDGASCKIFCKAGSAVCVTNVFRIKTNVSQKLIQDHKMN